MYGIPIKHLVLVALQFWVAAWACRALPQDGVSTVPESALSTTLPDLYEASIADLQAGLQKRQFTSVDLVKAYFARIDEVNLQGPTLRAVLEKNPSALRQAAALDAERLLKGARGPLHGIPILVKDNIATLHSEGMNTTAGSFALLGSVVPRDAGVAAKLRTAGAIILGKSQMSEWANFRGIVPSGFSGRLGQASSPYVPLGDPSGSSSGSGIGTAIGLAAGALGSETDGSIIFPASNNNLVGIKPTVGLTSRAGVVPISQNQDTVGPLARSVTDAVAILQVIAGRDARDNFTLSQPAVLPDFSKALNVNALKGARVGVPRQLFTTANPNVIAAFNATLDVFRQLGATVVDPADLPDTPALLTTGMLSELTVLLTDFKVQIAEYLDDLVSVPTGVKTLADLIAFNNDHASEELVQPFWTDQSRFTAAEPTSRNQTFIDALATEQSLSREQGIDAALQQFNLDALILPSLSASFPAAIAGYPLVGVPLGFQPANLSLSPATPVRALGPNMPFGISFMGTAFSEFKLISLAFAYEQATHTRLKQLALSEAIPRTQLKDVLK